jgi:hypothetical protein
MNNLLITNIHKKNKNKEGWALKQEKGCRLAGNRLLYILIKKIESRRIRLICLTLNLI